MTNNTFLYATLDSHNSFLVPAVLTINGMTFTSQVKLDTGCAQSTIPFRRLANVSHQKSLLYKQQDIANGLQMIRSYGVSDTDEIRRADAKLLKAGHHLECTALKFKHPYTPLILNGYSLQTDVCVNYDRTSNILIGMDILKQLQFVCDKSVVTDKYTFIGCLQSQDDKTEYRNALKKHFRLM